MAAPIRTWDISSWPLEVRRFLDTTLNALIDLENQTTLRDSDLANSLKRDCSPIRLLDCIVRA